MTRRQEWEESRALLEQLKKLAREKGVPILTAQQPPPNGAHSGPIPAGPIIAGPIIADGIYLTHAARKP